MSIHVLSWVLTHSESTLGRRLVLIALAEYAHDDGSKSFPTIATLQERTRLSRTAVQRALRQLVTDGEIVQTGSTQAGVAVYRILMEGAANRSPGGPHSAAPGGCVRQPDPPEGLYPSEPLSVESVVIAHWQSMRPLPTHRTIPDRWKRQVDKAVKAHGVEDVKAAIANYATVLASPDHRWTYRWTLGEFLTRGLERFLPEMDPLSNFRISDGGENPAAVAAWNLVRLRYGGDQSVILSERTTATLKRAQIDAHRWRTRTPHTERTMRSEFLDAW